MCAYKERIGALFVQVEARLGVKPISVWNRRVSRRRDEEREDRMDSKEVCKESGGLKEENYTTVDSQTANCDLRHEATYSARPSITHLYLQTSQAVTGTPSQSPRPRLCGVAPVMGGKRETFWKGNDEKKISICADMKCLSEKAQNNMFKCNGTVWGWPYMWTI